MELIRKYNKFTVILSFISAFLLISSCNTVRKAIKTPIKEEGPEYLFSQLKKNELKYDYISAKFSAEAESDEKKISCKGQIRIRKDSIIWISISPALGIEMARLLITNDTLIFINYLESSYFTGNIEYINKLLNTSFDFDILQSLIIGNDFSLYDSVQFKASIDNMEYKLSTTERKKLKKYVKSHMEEPKVFIQNIWLNPETFKITKLMIKEKIKDKDPKQDNRKLEAYYSDFIAIENTQQLFPDKILFDVTAEKPIKINIEYLKTELNLPQQFPLKIPSKYKQIK